MLPRLYRSGGGARGGPGNSHRGPIFQAEEAQDGGHHGLCQWPGVGLHVSLDPSGYQVRDAHSEWHNYSEKSAALTYEGFEISKKYEEEISPPPLGE